MLNQLKKNKYKREYQKKINIRQRRFCNVRSFIAVRYAEKRISFKFENERINSNLNHHFRSAGIVHNHHTYIFGWSQDVLWSEWLNIQEIESKHRIQSCDLLDKIRNFIKSYRSLPWIFDWSWIDITFRMFYCIL